MASLAYNLHSGFQNPNPIINKQAPSRILLHQVRVVSSPARYPGRTARMAHSPSTQGGRNPDVQHQRITIHNSHGEKLVGVLHETGSTDLVILCHGFRSSKEHSTMMSLASALEKNSITCFRFDFSGNGESEGSFQYGNYCREADDLHSVVLHFLGVGRVITAILGHSKGGNVVLLYASLYRDVHSVINVSGRFNLEGGIKERLGGNALEKIKKDGYIDVNDKTGNVQFRVTEESLMDRLNTNMQEACLSIECRVLTVHGSSDEIIPVEDALEFDKIIPNHKLHIIEGADHRYTSHQAELASIVLDFIREGLQQDNSNQVEVNKVRDV